MSDKPLRVLVVEQSVDIRRMERELVRQAFPPGSVEVVEESFAAVAVDRYKTEVFHLLLMDVSSEQESPAIHELVHASRVRQRCPVIAFSTGRIDRDTLQILATDHCFAIFPKPFDPKDVQETILEALEYHATTIDAVVSPVLHGIMRMLHPEDKSS